MRPLPIVDRDTQEVGEVVSGDVVKVLPQSLTMKRISGAQDEQDLGDG